MNKLIEKHHKAYTLQGKEIYFLAQKALFIPEFNCLIIADWHLGKSSTFRKEGIYLPANIIEAELEKMELLLKSYEVKKLIIAGDLFHSKANKEWPIFKKWLAEKEDFECILIKGNHDVLGSDLYQIPNFQIVKGCLNFAGFNIIHHPSDCAPANWDEKTISICGHLHPAIRLGTKMANRVSLDCFWLQAWQIVLPAFGLTTGQYQINPNKGDTVLAIAGKEIVELKF